MYISKNTNEDNQNLLLYDERTIFVFQILMHLQSFEKEALHQEKKDIAAEKISKLHMERSH